jgi:hypothetical protein
MSVKRNVTVPRGRSAIATSCGHHSGGATSGGVSSVPRHGQVRGSYTRLLMMMKLIKVMNFSGAG